MVVTDEAKVYVNGEYVSGKLELMHGDRYLTPILKSKVSNL